MPATPTGALHATVKARSPEATAVIVGAAGGVCACASLLARTGSASVPATKHTASAERLSRAVTDGPKNIPPTWRRSVRPRCRTAGDGTSKRAQEHPQGGYAAGGGGVASTVPGGTVLAWPTPQQNTVPSLRTAHAWWNPTLTATNDPAGGAAWPRVPECEPQHDTAPPGRRPQEYLYPDDTAVNAPVGGANDPPVLSPQHATVASLRRPHVCDNPADTVENVPAGEAAWPCAFTPQHATVPSLRTPQV